MTDDFLVHERNEMVNRQMIARGIDDSRVIEAMKKIPRHEFVPERFWDMAYADGPVAIGEEQTISQPYIAALMTELLEPRSGDKALEVGTGSGYQTAILAELTQYVFSIEIFPSLYESAQKRLEKLGYAGVHLRLGDGSLGWNEEAPFDKIIVTAAALEEIPAPLIEQLKEGGKIVIPVGGSYQELIVGEKSRGMLKQKSVTSVKFVPLIQGRKSDSSGD